MHVERNSRGGAQCLLQPIETGGAGPAASPKQSKRAAEVAGNTDGGFTGVQIHCTETLQPPGASVSTKNKLSRKKV